MFGLSACHVAAPPGRRFCPDAQNRALRGMCIVSETGSCPVSGADRWCMRLGNVRPKKNSPDAQPQKYPCAGR